jgi:hypothetical protein
MSSSSTLFLPFLTSFVPITSSHLSPLKQRIEFLSFRWHSFTYRAVTCIHIPKIHFPWRLYENDLYMVKQKLYFIAVMHDCATDLAENTRRIFLIHYLKNMHKIKQILYCHENWRCEGGFLKCMVILYSCKSHRVALKYRVIHNSLRYFWPLRYSSRDGHTKGSISIGREPLKFFLCTRHRGILTGFTARGQSWWNIGWTGNKKALCLGICQHWVNCDSATEVSDHVPHRTTYG